MEKLKIMVFENCKDLGLKVDEHLKKLTGSNE